MDRQNKVSGVVLAGGQGRRMQHQDKGLVMFKNRPLVAYALSAMQPLVDDLLISANRNQAQYRRFGCPVIRDANASFDGPLAGILAAMQHAQQTVLLVMPCDSPRVETVHLQRLLSALRDNNAEIAVASDGQRIHPVFLALQTGLQPSLQAYLQQGERKLQQWLRQHELCVVDFSDTPGSFININTLLELENLEAGKCVKGPQSSLPEEIVVKGRLG